MKCLITFKRQIKVFHIKEKHAHSGSMPCLWMIPIFKLNGLYEIKFRNNLTLISMTVEKLLKLIYLWDVLITFKRRRKTLHNQEGHVHSCSIPCLWMIPICKSNRLDEITFGIKYKENKLTLNSMIVKVELQKKFNYFQEAKESFSH